MTLQAIDESCEAHIASLDDALSLISKAGILFERLDKQGQRHLLQHMVERVVINPEGQVLRMVLRTPFSYLRGLIDSGRAGPATSSREARNHKNKTSIAAGSFLLSAGASTGIRTTGIYMGRFEDVVHPKNSKSEPIVYKDFVCIAMTPFPRKLFE